MPADLTSHTELRSWLMYRTCYAPWKGSSALPPSTMMEMVQKHFMGRVQNTFFFIGTFLQLAASLAVGAIAEHVSLVVAFGIIGILYVIAALTAASCRVKGQPV